MQEQQFNSYYGYPQATKAPAMPASRALGERQGSPRAPYSSASAYGTPLGYNQHQPLRQAWVQPNHMPPHQTMQPQTQARAQPNLQYGVPYQTTVHDPRQYGQTVKPLHSNYQGYRSYNNAIAASNPKPCITSALSAPAPYPASVPFPASPLSNAPSVTAMSTPRSSSPLSTSSNLSGFPSHTESGAKAYSTRIKDTPSNMGIKAFPVGGASSLALEGREDIPVVVGARAPETKAHLPSRTCESVSGSSAYAQVESRLVQSVGVGASSLELEPCCTENESLNKLDELEKSLDTASSYNAQSGNSTNKLSGSYAPRERGNDAVDTVEAVGAASGALDNISRGAGVLQAQEDKSMADSSAHKANTQELSDVAATSCREQLASNDEVLPSREAASHVVEPREDKLIEYEVPVEEEPQLAYQAIQANLGDLLGPKGTESKRAADKGRALQAGSKRARSRSSDDEDRGPLVESSVECGSSGGGSDRVGKYHEAQVINASCDFKRQELLLSEVFAGANLHLERFSLPAFDQSLLPLVPQVEPSYVFDEAHLNLILSHLQQPYGDSLFISGPTGCGKTSFILQIAARLGWPVESITLSQNSEIADLVGHTVLRKGQLYFEYGPLARAMIYGEILLLNEVDLMSAGELAALNDVLEGRALCVYENNGEIIYPHPFFRVVVTANSKGAGDNSGHYMGVRKQNKAFLDRYVFVEFDYPNYEQEQSLILKSIDNFNPDLVKYFITFAHEVRYGARSGHVKSNHEILKTMEDRISLQYQDYKGCLEEAVASNAVPSIKDVINDALLPAGEGKDGEMNMDNLEIGEIDDLQESLSMMNAPISVPLSNRSLLRICRYFVAHDRLPVSEAVRHAFASRLDCREFAFVMRMCFEIFGYHSDFNKLPRLVKDVEAYLKERRHLVNEQVLSRVLLSEQQVRALVGLSVGTQCTALKTGQSMDNLIQEKNQQGSELLQELESSESLSPAQEQATEAYPKDERLVATDVAAKSKRAQRCCSKSNSKREEISAHED